DEFNALTASARTYAQQQIAQSPMTRTPFEKMMREYLESQQRVQGLSCNFSDNRRTYVVTSIAYLLRDELRICDDPKKVGHYDSARLNEAMSKL
ncbi:hypothetical protein HZB03_01910, partial [Candidatus Woesearchaeota archaeon]|nr:hypothetical protein [Candidatus Woesearchaeota archaeon]